MEYKQGKSNVPADMLSCMINTEGHTSCNVLDDVPKWKHVQPIETNEDDEQIS